MPNNNIVLSIIIVSFNTKDLTRRCIQHVEKHAKDVVYELLVVDNASMDGSAQMIKQEFPWVRLIRLSKNKGFAGGNIPAMKRAKGKYLLLLNSDAFLSEGVLKNTITYMDRHPGIGILGCKLTNPDGSLQPSARMLPSPFNKFLHITGLAARFPKSRFFGRVDFSWWDHSKPKSVGWVVGAFFLIRGSCMGEIGLLDDRYFLYFEEIDYCLKAGRKGWDVVFYPYARVIHLGGQSAAKVPGKISTKGKQMISIRLTSEFRFYRKWFGPFYVFLSAMIEWFWNGMILAKNTIKPSIDSRLKRDDARAMMGLIMKTLREDEWGKGGKKIVQGSRFKVQGSGSF